MFVKPFPDTPSCSITGKLLHSSPGYMPPVKISCQNRPPSTQGYTTLQEKGYILTKRVMNMVVHKSTIKKTTNSEFAKENIHYLGTTLHKEKMDNALGELALNRSATMYKVHESV